MKTTIRDVARAAGVSVATASMALNGRAGVSEATRSRVLQISRRMNYIPNYSARALVTQDSSCIGLLIPEIQNPFYSAIVDILTQLAEQAGWTLLLGISNNSAETEAGYVQAFLARQTRGVIVVPLLADHPDSRHLELLRAADIPIVFCTEIYDGCSEPVVMCDFEAGQYAATKYLTDKGMRDFWFVSTGMDVGFARLRYAGYRRALREAGIAENPRRELMLGQPRFDEAYQNAEKICRELPEAVICINDIMTLGIMKRLSEHGYRIPEDVSVIGFDDIMFSELVTPPLTTVRQPVREICEKTMALMLKKLAAGENQAAVGKGEVCLVPPQLIVRGTTR